MEYKLDGVIAFWDALAALGNEHRMNEFSRKYSPTDGLHFMGLIKIPTDGLFYITDPCYADSDAWLTDAVVETGWGDRNLEHAYVYTEYKDGRPHNVFVADGSTLLDIRDFTEIVGNPGADSGQQMIAGFSAWSGFDDGDWALTGISDPKVFAKPANDYSLCCNITCWTPMAADLILGDNAFVTRTAFGDGQFIVARHVRLDKSVAGFVLIMGELPSQFDDDLWNDEDGGDYDDCDNCPPGTVYNDEYCEEIDEYSDEPDYGDEDDDNE